MNPNDPELLAEIAKAICRVKLCGGDPSRPATRWGVAGCERQEFPEWRDYLDEARAAVGAFFIYESRLRTIRNKEAARLADAREG